MAQFVRRLFKWAATTSCLALTLAGIATIYFIRFGLGFPFGMVTFESFGLVIAWGCLPNHGFYWAYDGLNGEFEFISTYFIFGIYPQWQLTGTQRFVSIPLWIFFVCAAILSVLLRRMERHESTDLCTCGYNLTGNESGVCPECGTAVNPNRDCTAKAT